MVESNQMTAEQARIQESISRRVLSYCSREVSLSDFIWQFNNFMDEINELAEQIFHPADSTKQELWIRQHPIMILMAYKLKGMILTNPDIGYIKAKAQVEDMANL